MNPTGASPAPLGHERALPRCRMTPERQNPACVPGVSPHCACAPAGVPCHCSDDDEERNPFSSGPQRVAGLCLPSHGPGVSASCETGEFRWPSHADRRSWSATFSQCAASGGPGLDPAGNTGIGRRLDIAAPRSPVSPNGTRGGAGKGWMLRTLRAHTDGCRSGGVACLQILGAA